MNTMNKTMMDKNSIQQEELCAVSDGIVSAEFIAAVGNQCAWRTEGGGSSAFVDMSKNENKRAAFLVETLDISNKKIADCSGIKFFPSLKNLYCDKNELTKLDLSQNAALEVLHCTRNKLGSLDVSHCENLKKIACGMQRDADDKMRRLELRIPQSKRSLWLEMLCLRDPEDDTVFLNEMVETELCFKFNFEYEELTWYEYFEPPEYLL